MNNYQFNGVQGWAGQLCQIRAGLSSSECLKKSFEEQFVQVHPGKNVSESVGKCFKR